MGKNNWNLLIGTIGFIVLLALTYNFTMRYWKSTLDVDTNFVVNNFSEFDFEEIQNSYVKIFEGVENNYTDKIVKYDELEEYKKTTIVPTDSVDGNIVISYDFKGYSNEVTVTISPSVKKDANNTSWDTSIQKMQEYLNGEYGYFKPLFNLKSINGEEKGMKYYFSPLIYARMDHLDLPSRSNGDCAYIGISNGSYEMCIYIENYKKQYLSVVLDDVLNVIRMV